ncbi:MAG: Holliday junction branch migration protein RuvA [Microscillaceae bacterium]|nr:Holliday junction branch migration protein RuvA [Microscillaceae bacterium]
MLAYIEGKLVHKEATYVVIEVQGLGYQLRVSLQTSSALVLGSICRLQTYLQVREDALTLFGFYEAEEKKVFLDLLSVSGIGTNTALIMLSSMSTTEIIEAIAREDVITIQRIKGIGRKTAERVIVELKDKIRKAAPELADLAPGEPTARSTFAQTKADALDALLTLGLPRATAEKNLQTIIQNQGPSLTLEELIKMALKV